MVSIAAGHDASGHVQQTDQADVQVQTGQEGEQQAPAQGQQDQQQQTAALSGEEAENLIGKKAYGADGQEVGEVTNLLIGSDGQARAAVIEFGGFLGIGSNEVAVDWSKLQVAEDRVIVSMTEDEIKSAPKYGASRSQSSSARTSNRSAERKPQLREAALAPLLFCVA